MQGEKIKILLVEDDAFSYIDVKEFLEKEGYSVITHPEKEIIDNYDDAVWAAATDIPHIAVLDIQIKGEKDGIEIGKYIRNNYYSPVIFLSANNTDENLRRSGLIGADGFVVKIGKPLELNQLRTDIRRLLPLAAIAYKKRSEGMFLLVKPVPASKQPKQEPTDNVFYNTRISWEKLMFVKTMNSDGAKNNLVLYCQDGQQFLHRNTLSDFAKVLPPWFARFNNSEIVNVRFINRKGKSEGVYYIDDRRFEITDTYRHSALPVISNFFF